MPNSRRIPAGNRCLRPVIKQSDHAHSTPPDKAMHHEGTAIMSANQGQQPFNGISRRGVLRGATLAAAGVATAGAMATALTGTAKATIINAQFGWAFCSRCSSLWWPNGGGHHAACLATGGTHVIGSNYSYGLNHDLPNLVNTSNPQPFWKWCVNCSELYWGGLGAGPNGSCPYYAGQAGTHLPGSNTSYDVEWQGPNGQAYGTNDNPQGWWRYCTKCAALFWSGPNSNNAGVCAGNYVVANQAWGHYLGGNTNYHVDWGSTTPT
jgi:hypothetical protein